VHGTARVDIVIPASELADVVAGLAMEDAERVQVVAFAVARAVRDAGDGEALPVLADLLTAASGVPDLNEGALINLLSAVQYATLLPAGARAGWTPPAEAVARLLRRGLGSSKLPREQAEGVLGALVDDGLAADWLGPDATRDLVGSRGSGDPRLTTRQRRRAVANASALGRSSGAATWR
jgi:hypothetical protein